MNDHRVCKYLDLSHMALFFILFYFILFCFGWVGVKYGASVQAMGLKPPIQRLIFFIIYIVSKNICGIKCKTNKNVQVFFLNI